MGPLNGVRVVELAGLGPAPFAGMVLADLGADVIRIDRPPTARQAGFVVTGDMMGRGKRSVAIDLKHAEGVALVLDLCADAEVLIEGFRPGVTERLGVGPQACHARNPALVYGRMTGFGQHGPLATSVGHDINYISIGGALGAIGRSGQPPTPPLNLVGDFGGGSMFLVTGVLAALLHARATGEGQVVDAAMVEGTALLTAPLWSGMRRTWSGRGHGLLDSGAPFYDVYEAADGGYVAVGAIEPQFYAALLDGLGIDPKTLPAQMDASEWPAVKERFAEVFRTRTRDEWAQLFADTDACVTPVLEPAEVERHPHNVARGSFVEVDGAVHTGPAPRLDRTPPAIAWGPPAVGAHTDEVLGVIGRDADELARLRAAHVIA